MTADSPRDSGLDLADLSALYERLDAEHGDELLQCLLMAAAQGPEAMMKVLEDLMLCHATEALMEEHEAPA